MAEIALVSVFAGLPDRRRKQGRRHSLPLCLALFTLAVAAGNQGFLAIGDWLKSYKQQLKELFEVDILPYYSTIRRALLSLDYKEYSARLAQFFEIEPISGETLALDGKVLRGSYLLETDNPHSQPHKAITKRECLFSRKRANFTTAVLSKIRAMKSQPFLNLLKL